MGRGRGPEGLRAELGQPPVQSYSCSQALSSCHHSLPWDHTWAQRLEIRVCAHILNTRLGRPQKMLCCPLYKGQEVGGSPRSAFSTWVRVCRRPGLTLSHALPLSSGVPVVC